MPNFIVLRLTPTNPVDAATFTDFLTGLTVNVFDISYANPKAGLPGDPTAPIGSAIFNLPQINPALPPLPIPLLLLPPIELLTYPANTTIAQSYFPEASGFPPQLDGVGFQSVATAVIPYNPAGPEYVSTDLRIQFVRAGVTLVDPDIYYDVQLFTSAGVPDPYDYQTLPASSVAAYVTLPEQLDPSLAQLIVPNDGSPPAYDQLLMAINKVLKADPGPAGQNIAALITANGPLTTDQSRNIAYEILWGPQPTLPTPPEALESMYRWGAYNTFRWRYRLAGALARPPPPATRPARPQDVFYVSVSLRQE